MDWFLTQAQSASPLFAVGCIIVVGVLWRQHIKDAGTIMTMSDANNKALTATAIAIEKASAATSGAIAQLKAAVEAERRREARRAGRR